jgi:predicted transcriptional regulator YdeE
VRFHFFKYLFSVAFILLFAGFVWAQNPSQTPPNQDAKSDTTKKTKQDSISYGPNTVTYVYERDFYYNKYKISPRVMKDTTLKMKGFRYADTLLNNIHRTNAIQKNNNTFQDLGNFGTAAQSIFYVTPTEIGTRLGYHVYDEYLWQPQNIKYYSSFSPYTELDVMLGGLGRSKANVTVARNIRINWSAGITYRRTESNKVFGRNTRRNDSHVNGQTYGFFTRYQTLNQRYKLLAHFSGNTHQVNENGGYATQIPASAQDTMQTLNELLTYSIAQWKYRVTTTNEPIRATQNKTVARIYHQYALFDSAKQDYLQIFHVGEYSRQKNEYSDATFKTNFNNTIGSNVFRSGVYPAVVYFDTTDVALANAVTDLEGRALAIKEPFYKTDFTQFDNHFGIKGQAAKFDYRAYFRARTYKMRHDFIVSSTHTDLNTGATSPLNSATSAQDILQNQYFAGGSLHYQFSDSAFLDAEIEHLLAKDFKLKAEYTNKFLTLGHEQAFYAPTQVQQRIYGTFFKWDNNFSNIYTIRTYGQAQIKLPFITLQPHVNFTNISNYVYFDQKITAQQTPDNISMLQVGFNTDFAWKYWKMKTNFVYSKNLGADLIRMPEFFVNVQLYYEKMFFKGALYGQIGTDIHYKSAFYANAYSAPLQQFYLQDRFTTDNYVVTDVFFNFKVSRALLFMKVVNVLQDIAGTGYFNTPVYLAQPRSFELGINWLFFD